MKKLKLTLIELLISMAIFTVMMSLLIKAFQLTTDTASKLEDQTQVYDFARLTMNLVNDDLAKHITHELKKFEYDSTSKSYLEKNKSLYFYTKTDSSEAEICFFIQSNEGDSNNNSIKNIKAIHYKMDTINGTTGLYRYEKNFSPNNTSYGIKSQVFEHQTTPNYLANLDSPDDISLIISDKSIVNFSVYVTGTHIDANNDGIPDHQNITVGDDSTTPSIGTYILKDIEQVRISLELVEENTGPNSTRTFTRTMYLQK